MIDVRRAILEFRSFDDMPKSLPGTGKLKSGDVRGIDALIKALQAAKRTGDLKPVAAAMKPVHRAMRTS